MLIVVPNKVVIFYYLWFNVKQLFYQKKTLCPPYVDYIKLLY